MPPTLEELYKANRAGRGIVTPQDLKAVTGILDTMQFNKSSHGAYDLVDVAAILPAGSFRKVNGGMAVSNGSSELDKIDLFPFGAIHQVDVAIIKDYPGGLSAYVKDKTILYAPGLAKSFETALIHGDDDGFKGLKEIATDNSKSTPTNASGSGSDYSSIIAVKWDPGLCTGLFNEKPFKKGLFVPVILNGGKSVLVDEFDGAGAATGKKLPVYQFSIEQNFGLKVIGETQIAVLTGIKDVDTYRPTKAMLDNLLDSIDAEAGNTKLYMRRTTRTLLKELKSVAYSNDDRSIERSVIAYDDIPIRITSQLTQTEDRVS